MPRESTPEDLGIDPLVSDMVFDRLKKAGFYGVSPEHRPVSLLFAQHLDQAGKDIFTLNSRELGELYKKFVNGSVR